MSMMLTLNGHQLPQAALQRFSQFDFDPISDNNYTFFGIDIGKVYNRNCLLLGVPYSKLFLAQNAISVLKKGGKVFLLDSDKSFKGFCEMLGGNYIEFDPKEPISINPFSYIPLDDSTQCDWRRNNFFNNFSSTLATMAAPIHGVTDLQQKILKRALFEVWEEKLNATSIDDIFNWLSAQDDVVSKDLGRMLFDYTSRGSYGGFFSREAEELLNNNLTVLDVEKLGCSTFIDVAMQLLLTNIEDNLISNMRKKEEPVQNVIILNEVTNILKSDLSLDFLSGTCHSARPLAASVLLSATYMPESRNLKTKFESMIDHINFN